MKLDEINSLLMTMDGNCSVIYPLIKNQIQAMNYKPEELTFPEEFLFFEDRYLTIKKHMLENNVEGKNVVDIGCQLGFQSFIFQPTPYVGIDYMSANFFKYKGCKSEFIVGNFKDLEIDLTNSIAISSMSLGFFESDATNDGKLSPHQLLNIEKLSQARHLYIASSEPFSREVISRFNHCELLIDESLKKSKGKKVVVPNYSLYYLTNVI